MEIQLPPVGRPTQFTGTISILNATGTNCFYTRIGKYAIIDYYFSWTTAESFSVIEIDMPSGLTIDTSFLGSTTAQRQVLGGPGIYHDPAGGTTPYMIIPRYKTSSVIAIHYIVQVSGASTIVFCTNTSASTPVGTANGSFITVTVKVPISGW